MNILQESPYRTTKQRVSEDLWAKEKTQMGLLEASGVKESNRPVIGANAE